MRRLNHELEAAAAVLALLERSRAESGDDALGSDIERLILDRCVSDLETTSGDALVLCRNRRENQPRR
jgi:hypothetical protein